MAVTQAAFDALAKRVQVLEQSKNELAPLFFKRADGQLSLNITGGLKLSNGQKLTQLFSDVQGGETITFPNESGRLSTYWIRQKPEDPTGNDITGGSWSIYLNTTTGKIKFWANINSVLYSAEFI